MSEVATPLASDSATAHEAQASGGKTVKSKWQPAVTARKATGARRVFIRELRVDGNATRSAGVAGVNLATVYKWRKQGKKFADAWQRARDIAKKARIDRYEATVDHVANGYEVPIYYLGEQVGTKTCYSVDALKFRLAAEHPRKYGRKHAAEQASTIAITIDARRQYLSDPIALALACDLEARLSLGLTEPLAIEQAAPPPVPMSEPTVVIDVTPPIEAAPVPRPAPISPVAPRIEPAPIVDAWADEPWVD